MHNSLPCHRCDAGHIPSIQVLVESLLVGKETGKIRHTGNTPTTNRIPIFGSHGTGGESVGLDVLLYGVAEFLGGFKAALGRHEAFI